MTEASLNPEAVAEQADVLADLWQAVAAGQHWFTAVLGAIGRWQLPEETVGGRHYRYVIGGEALDWLLLAERLCDSLDGAVPVAEKEALLFTGVPPVTVSQEEMRCLMGERLYRAHLNFFYGVTVEEALHLAVEEELLKEQRSAVWRSRHRTDEEAYLHIYGQSRADLLRAFSADFGLSDGDGLSVSELKEFTYWLFKYRLKRCDPARVASDTRKSLLTLARLQSRRHLRTRARPPAPPSANGQPRRVVDV